MPPTPRRNMVDLTSADQVDQVFMISQPQLRTTTRGEYYIAVYLSDKTGKANGRLWQATESIYRSLPPEGFAQVKGRCENYQGSLQIVIESIRPITAQDVDMTDFMPATDKDVTAMFAELTDVLTEIENPHLAGLVAVFLADEPLMAQFRRAPAAIALHHAYLGGLLEHTLSLVKLGRRVLPHYPDLNRDLVLTALFLHDIGKTTELDYDISFKYSDQGRLLGHLVKGVMLIEEKIAGLDDPSAFPRPLADSLEHIMVAHHGQREFGCPVLPATPEAFMVHYLDNLDSKMALTFAEIAADSGATNWTNYCRALESPLFKLRPDEL